ncbi:borealin isoform X2 [Diorhabda carinulata]|uniref:borealin isoform X2 n=1 Tax=Diorhabda sublineata TaxID=1163346 RepID=UPI0024E0E151|nr:borealin isoform X2 [Diorhabda sublineata]XP_057656233.1 borealin isoform X2 [Diorhabda carinulata]
MPRTKINTKKTNKKLEEEGINKQLLLSNLVEIQSELVNEYKMKARLIIEENCAQSFTHFAPMLHRKVSDVLENGLSSTSTLPSLNLTSKKDILSQTKSVKKNNKPVKRSSSLVDEVGRTSTRQSRSKAKKNEEKRTRKTRSLSRTNQSKNNFITPANKKNLPSTYGLVTPKCKPNMPQVLLRRPKTGEVALSFQGSPLMTAPVVTDELANINIPLNDGTLLSLRAQEGLRLSQIPQFDKTILKQLDTLGQNISLVLKAAKQLK